MATAISSSDVTFASTDSSAPAASNAPISRARLWTGRVLSIVPSLFLLMDGMMKILQVKEVVEGSAKVGWPLDTLVPIGTVLVVSTVLYLIPRTAFFGAILLTAYLGGAVATHVRLNDPLFTHTLFPTYFAIMLWAGLTLRDRRLESLVRAR